MAINAGYWDSSHQKQERAYSGSQSRSAWRLNGEMRRRLILRVTGFTR